MFASPKNGELLCVERRTRVFLRNVGMTVVLSVINVVLVVVLRTCMVKFCPMRMIRNEPLVSVVLKSVG